MRKLEKVSLSQSWARELKIWSPEGGNETACTLGIIILI